jgi:2-hydroxychromene-2-carboxylate isomerase
MTTIDLYFDFRRPYCYLAHFKLGSLGTAVNYRPMDIVAVGLADRQPSTK